jgi:hypothetical protein
MAQQSWQASVDVDVDRDVTNEDLEHDAFDQLYERHAATSAGERSIGITVTVTGGTARSAVCAALRACTDALAEAGLAVTRVSGVEVLDGRARPKSVGAKRFPTTRAPVPARSTARRVSRGRPGRAGP